MGEVNVIDGEIRVGDRLIYHVGDKRVPIEVLDLGVEHPLRDDPLIRVRDRDGEFCFQVEELRETCVRADSGWTRITPETLPGDDVEQVLALCGMTIWHTARVSPEGWSWNFKHCGYTHWRPIPADWLPLPVKDSSASGRLMSPP